MKHRFKAKIYKTGINWCVDVPRAITKQMEPVKGYIKVTGKINGFVFSKSLVPVKDSPYRLFVNQVMMKGGKTALGEMAVFELEQVKSDTSEHNELREYVMPDMLKRQLSKYKLLAAFSSSTPSRQKDILKYLNGVKTEETLQRNIEKVIDQLRRNEKNVRIP
jgi:hypothetical protein